MSQTASAAERGPDCGASASGAGLVRRCEQDLIGSRYRFRGERVNVADGRGRRVTEITGGRSLTLRQRSAVTRAATDAVSTTAEATVFLDPSGRRWRTLLLLGVPIAVLLVATLAYGGVRGFEAPVAVPPTTAA